ncbi:cytokinin oxidase [Legionella steelei]|uniref:Cytokinin oxidase n=1 Tax=Legionella steelei TaxID=947033 RepID=A0A0W0ZGV4_9GAMM|nr:FAD-binding protein [Legionella steelei]KTD68212.1 cytokinin oxidase [Legionella steelei]
MAIELRKKLQDIYNRFPSIGRYAEIPASWIDRMDLEEESSFMNEAWFFIRKRIIFLMFPVLAAIDVITSFICATTNFVGALFSSDTNQEFFFAKSREYATLFSKSLLGLTFSLFGFISPKLVSFFFLPEKKYDKAMSGGALYKADVENETPRTLEDLQEIIRQARKNGQSIMAVGAGKSQGKQFIPLSKEGKKGILIDMSEFNEIVIDKDAKTAKVGAGVRWVDLQIEANKKKLALKVMQASNIFSVGGSIGTNIHGWNHRSGNLANVVQSLKIINSDGELETIDKYSPKFGKVLGGFGLFGIVVSAEIELTDNENLVEQSVDVSIENYLKHFRKNVQPDDKIRMHLFRLSLAPNNLLGNGVAVNYIKLDNSAPVESEKINKEDENGTRMERIMVNVARRSGYVRQKYWEGERHRLLNNETPMTTNEIMQPSINAMFNNSVSESEWLQEFFVPGENLANFIKELGALLTKNKVALINSSVRFVKKDEYSTLGYTREGDRFAVVLCFNQALKKSEVVKTKKWIREANDLVIKHGGTFYLPYQQFSSQEQFEKAYGKDHVDEFKSAKENEDRQGVFYNGLYQHYLALKENKPNYFKELMASAETKKRFAGFLENVLQRIDTDKFYVLLEDILKYNDTHEEIYAELLRCLPNVMPGKLGSLRRILGSLSSIKEDLTAQAKALMPDVETIDGLVEIGYPGRFVAGFKSAFKVTGPITAVYEQQSMTDYVQTGIPRPYDNFVKLDYNVPDLSSIPDNNAEVITCYVGLHHFPEDQLEQFLKNVRRILRPNGRFVLVDHDAHDKESLLMAHMAHSVFNAVNGISLEKEMTETRNFRPMDHWKSLLKEYGLYIGDLGPNVAMIRNGDPSRNTMVSFVKLQPKPLSQLGKNQAMNDENLEKPYHSKSLTMFSKSLDKSYDKQSRSRMNLMLLF